MFIYIFLLFPVGFFCGLNSLIKIKHSADNTKGMEGEKSEEERGREGKKNRRERGRERKRVLYIIIINHLQTSWSGEKGLKQKAEIVSAKVKRLILVPVSAFHIVIVPGEQNINNKSLQLSYSEQE